MASHDHFNVKFVEPWNAIFLRISINGLFLVDVNTGRYSILTENQFSNFRQKKKNNKWKGAKCRLKGGNATKHDESYLLSVPKMLT